MSNANTLAAVAASGFRRNRIHNGEFVIGQLGSGPFAVGNGTLVDRWVSSASVASKLTAEIRGAGGVSPDTPYSLRYNVVAAQADASGNVFLNLHHAEGINLRDLMWGTAGAKPVTVSFWAKCSVGGTFVYSVRNHDATRSYVTTYTLVAGVAKRVILTIPGDTAGTWRYSNTLDFMFAHDLGCGSQFHAPVLNAWQTGNYVSHASATKLIATNSATFDLADVQLEVGTIATPFERQMLADIYRDCLRYRNYPKSLIISFTNGGAGQGFHEDYPHPEIMRANPTGALNNPNYSNCSGLTVNATSIYSARIQVTPTAAGNGFCIFDLYLDASLT